VADKVLPDLPLNPESRGKFGWNDTDVVLLAEDGSEMTPRQAKEAQLERLRAEVAEDLPEESTEE
jgi:hypothetical protein